MRIKFIRPIAAAALFFVLTVYCTYYLGSLSYFHINPSSEAVLFLSSPFNMSTEGSPLYNLYLPTALIFIFGVYLKNFNSAFQKKCNLRAVFLLQ